MEDNIHEECGVFGTINNPSATESCILALHAMQHRGHEAFGVVVAKEWVLSGHYYDGCVNNKIDNNICEKSSASVGHVRYSTSGSFNLKQPICAKLQMGDVAIAHNGNLVNAQEIRENLISKGAIFQSDVDSEVFIHLIAQAAGSSIIEKIKNALQAIKGAYSLVILAKKKLIGVRDRFGIRPLSIGKVKSSYVIVSETCALDIIGAELVRDVLPGEIVSIDEKNNISSSFVFEKRGSRFCIFEYIYFARPDSNLEGRNVYAVRKNIGAQLAKESPVKDVDFVVAVPDSGIPAALGYANELNIPIEMGIVRNHYVARTFIEPTEYTRSLGVKLKHNPNKSLLNGKNIVLVDDSIVRGTTMKKIIIALRESGVKNIHIRISSPEVKNPCFYGIDLSTTKDLISAHYNVEQIREFLQVESLYFISINGLYCAIKKEQRNSHNPQFCDACFTGDYVV